MDGRTGRGKSSSQFFGGKKRERDNQPHVTVRTLYVRSVTMPQRQKFPFPQLQVYKQVKVHTELTTNY